MKKIFFVDDNPDIVAIYRESLIAEGFEVLVAEDGLAAMKSLQQVKPDLVILDLMMPKLNGADVLKYIRTNPVLKHTKVIIFSNAHQTDIALDAAKMGPDATIHKLNCTTGLLIEAVKNLLGQEYLGI